MCGVSVCGGRVYVFICIYIFFSSSFTWRSGKQPHAVTSRIEELEKNLIDSIRPF